MFVKVGLILYTEEKYDHMRKKYNFLVIIIFKFNRLYSFLHCPNFERFARITVVRKDCHVVLPAGAVVSCFEKNQSNAVYGR